MSLTTFKGGSNYLACAPDTGVVSQFHAQKPLILTQLAKMYGEGQRTLRLPLMYCDGAQGNVNLDSTDGWFPGQAVENLQALLDAMKGAGFERAIISLHPQWDNSPFGRDGSPLWHTFGDVENKYLETAWGICWRLHEYVLKVSPIPIWVDLCNEALPRLGWAPAIWTYCQQLFRKWVVDSHWPDALATTVGFSAEEAANLAAMKTIYTVDGQLYQPPFQDIHIYGDRNRTAAQKFIDAHKAAPNTAFIVGESLAEDLHSSTDFAYVIPFTGHPVGCVAQWPIAYDGSEVICPDYSVYAAKGF